MNYKVSLPLWAKLCLSFFLSSSSQAIKDADVAGILHVHDVQFAEDKYKLNTSKRVFEIRANGKKYIVMGFRNKDSEAHKLAEIEMAKMLSTNGFGPVFLGSPANNEFYVVEFIDRPLRYHDLDEQKLRDLGKLTRRVHDYKYSKNGKSQSDRLKKHSKKIQKRGIAVPDGFMEAVDNFLEGEKKLDAKMGFCHGDLNPSNVRVRENGSIVFIDWLNAGNGNVYEELGYVVQTYGMDEQQINVFLEGYLGETPTKDFVAKVKSFAKRTCLLTAAVWFGFSETSHDRKIPMKDRVKGLDDMLKDLKSVEEYSRTDQIPSVKSANKGEVKKFALSAWREYKENAEEMSFFGKFKRWISSFR